MTEKARLVASSNITITTVSGQDVTMAAQPIAVHRAFNVVVTFLVSHRPRVLTNVKVRCLIDYPGKGLPYTELDSPNVAGSTTFTYPFMSAPVSSGTTVYLTAQLVEFDDDAQGIVVAANGPIQITVSA